MENKCDMEKTCLGAVNYIDSKGFIYCDTHAQRRKAYTSCRKLTTKERNGIEASNKDNRIVALETALRNLREASTEAYKQGRVDALAFVAAGNILSDNAG